MRIPGIKFSFQAGFLFLAIIGYCQVVNSQFSDSIEIITGTFRGNNERNYYGSPAPSRLDVIWKFYLGKGETVISRKIGTRIWEGAGWTGQALIVREGTHTYLIQGAYDHHLRKINIEDGKEVWKYKFDDVVKGTGTLFMKPSARNKEESLIILQGSRLGVGNYLDSKDIPSYRAISYFSGKELWRLNMKWAGSYSRDVDGSALILDGKAYIGFENGIFTVFDPDPAKAGIRDSMLQPLILQEEKLYNREDVISHNNNVVTESSPALLRNKIFLASGSGHVYGYNLNTRKLDWDFFIGSDMDGSVVITSDSCLLVSVEKQYITGKGGVFKLDPLKKPVESVVWYFEVADTSFSGWKGGVIGTVGINDKYVGEKETHMAAIAALDGYLYIIDHKNIDPVKNSTGPDGKTKFHSPVFITRLKLGPSISSPILTNDKLIFTGYDGIFLFSYSLDKRFKKLAYYPAPCEASPVIMQNRIYIASRNGYLYCFGENP